MTNCDNISQQQQQHNVENTIIMKMIMMSVIVVVIYIEGKAYLLFGKSSEIISQADIFLNCKLYFKR